MGFGTKGTFAKCIDKVCPECTKDVSMVPKWSFRIQYSVVTIGISGYHICKLNVSFCSYSVGRFIHRAEPNKCIPLKRTTDRVFIFQGATIKNTRTIINNTEQWRRSWWENAITIFYDTNKDDNGTTAIQIYQKSLPHTKIHIIIYGYKQNTWEGTITWWRILVKLWYMM